MIGIFLILLLAVSLFDGISNILPIGVVSESPLILDLSVAVRYKRNFSINLVKAHYSHGFEFTALPPMCSQRTDGIFAFNDDNCAMRLKWQGGTLTIFEEEAHAESEQGHIGSAGSSSVYVVLRDADAAIHQNNRVTPIDSFCRPRAIGELMDRREVFELRMIVLSGISSTPSPVCGVHIQLSGNYSLLYEQMDNDVTYPKHTDNHSFVGAVIFLSLLTLIIAVIVCRPPADQSLSSMTRPNKSSEAALPGTDQCRNGKSSTTTFAGPPHSEDDQQPSTDLHTKVEWSNTVTRK